MNSKIFYYKLSWPTGIKMCLCGQVDNRSRGRSSSSRSDEKKEILEYSVKCVVEGGV